MVNTLPKVSIVTRTKDRAILLRRAIKSVISQSYSNWELIIVNDGGDPGPVAKLIGDFSKDLSGKVTLISNPKSIGMEAASNKGLKVAKGDFILIHDDDDSLHPCFLERMLAKAEEYNSTGIVCYAVRVLEEIADNQVFISQTDIFQPQLQEINLFRIMQSNLFPPISFMYKRKVFEEIGLYDENLPVLGDWDFNIRFMSKYDIDVLPEPLAFYHHRPNSNGVYGNSVIAGIDKHQKYLNILLNKYLRDDLSKSVSGIGFLWNMAQGMERK